MNLEKYQQYSRIARGLEQADLVLKDARIINVFTEEIIRGDIAIQDGIIAGIGSFQGKEERDLGGKYVCPGFIDSHLHLESTLVTPAELVTVASRHGTTTFIVDPHESANVSGLAGHQPIHLVLQMDDVLTLSGDIHHLLIHHAIQSADFLILLADELLVKPQLHLLLIDRKSTRLNSSHITRSRMPSSA